MNKSNFTDSLGKYRRPKIGEKIGEAKIVKILSFDDIIDDMSDKELESFKSRVENFLGDTEKYFECILLYPNGDIDQIDWSEYLVIKNKGD